MRDLRAQPAKFSVRLSYGGPVSRRKDAAARSIARAFAGRFEGTGFSFTHNRRDLFLSFDGGLAGGAWGHVERAGSALLSNVDDAAYLEVVRLEGYFVDNSEAL